MSESFRGKCKTNGRMNGQTDGGEIKGPFGFHPGPKTTKREQTDIIFIFNYTAQRALALKLFFGEDGNWRLKSKNKKVLYH